MEGIRIHFSEKMTALAELSVFNSAGQAVLHRKMVLFDGVQIDLGKLAPGVYWVRIGDQFQKLIIK